MDFRFTENYEKYRDILNMRAVDCLCKHVCSLDGEKASKVYELGQKVGYKQVIWGYGEGYSELYEMNRVVHLSRIQRIVYDKLKFPVRIVIGEQGVPWVDNLHTTIAGILCFGEDMLLSEIPVYIVDMRENIPVLVNVESSIDMNYKGIAGIIDCAEKRIARVHKDLYDIKYTIGEFMVDNKISRGSFVLSESYFDNYRSS